MSDMLSQHKNVNIFADNCERYWAVGLPVMPLRPREKRPTMLEWQQLQSRMPSIAEQTAWLLCERNGNLGLPLGPQSGLVAIDVDTDDPKVLGILEKILPRSPWRRIGQKGFVLVYKYDGQPIIRIKYKDENGKSQTLVEMLGAGSQIVLPPSIHPKTGQPYVANCELIDVLDQVGSLPPNIEQILRVALADSGLHIGGREAQSNIKTEGKSGGVSALLKDQAKRAIIAKAKPDNLASVLAGCAWMQHCEADAASLKEPEWHAMLSISGRCENGRELSHKLSEPYPEYSEKETDDKLHHAVNDAGPVTCNKVADEFGFESCARCPFRASINSPMTLASQSPSLVREQAGAVYVIELRRYLNLTTGKLLAPEAFGDGIQARVGAQPHSKMMSSKTMAKVEATDYRPGDPNLIVHQKDGSKAVNLWQRGGVWPAAGDPKPLLEFFERFIPDKPSRAHVIQYLAHLVRHPSVKIEHGIVITGGYGTGKGTLRDIMYTMFGLKNVQKVEGEELSDKNNSKWVNCQVLVFEETSQGEKFEVYNRTKELVTGETFRVQDKYITRYDGRTPRGIFMASNDVAPITIMRRDRRWFVCDTPETPETEEEVEANRTFFANLRTVLNRDDTTVAAFMHYLLEEVSLKGFTVKGEPPMTAAKKRAMEDSRTPAAGVLAELIAVGAPPFDRDVVSASQVLEAIKLSGWAHTVERMSMKKVADAIRGIGGFPVNMIDGEQMQVRVTRHMAPRLWGIRNKAEWVNATTDELRTEWLGGKPASEAEVVQLRNRGLARAMANAS